MVEINYLRLINNFWDNVRFYENYKPHYLVVYFSIIDSCNKNFWKPTMIPIELNIAKTCISKKMFYEAINWLQENKLLKYTAGKNGYSMATFEIIEVHKVTSTDTATHTSTNTSTNTATDTHLINNKQETKNSKTKEEIIFNSELVKEQLSKIDLKQDVRSAFFRWIEYDTITNKRHYTIARIDSFCMATLRLYKSDEHMIECIYKSISSGYKSIIKFKEEEKKVDMYNAPGMMWHDPIKNPLEIQP